MFMTVFLIKLIFQTTICRGKDWNIHLFIVLSAFGSKQLLQKYLMMTTSPDAKNFHLLSPARAAGVQY